MAEEKKDTTKKNTTTKKKVEEVEKNEVKEEVKEEVQIERRFCTNCGKELKDGEDCDCTANNRSEVGASFAVTVNGDVIVNTCKNIWDTIISVFKKPASTIEEEVKSGDTNKTVIITIILAVCFAFCLMAFISKLEQTANALTYGLSGMFIGISYLQVFIYGILIYAILFILPVLASLIVAKIVKNNDFTFKKAYKLYITSNAPLVLAYLGLTIIILLDVSLLNLLGYIAFFFISAFCFFNFIFGFNNLVKVKDDIRSYATTGLMALWVVMVIVAFFIVLTTVGVSIVTDGIGNTSDYSDIFDW